MRSARAGRLVGILGACSAVACTTLARPLPAALELVPGWSLSEAPAGCQPLYWQSPDGETLGLCPDLDGAIPIERANLFAAGLRESREPDGTWYWVDLYLESGLRRRIEAALDRGPGQAFRPYALRMQGEALRIDPDGETAYALVLTGVRERERAEALAASLAAPVIRATRPAEGARPAIVPLVRILADPTRWLGERVAITGYLSGHALEPASELYLSKQHARAYDLASAIHLADPSGEGALARSACLENWVTAEGTVISSEGPQLVNLELTQLTELRLAAPPFTRCWPAGPEPEAR